MDYKKKVLSYRICNFIDADRFGEFHRFTGTINLAMIIVSLIRSNCDLMICHRLVLLFENRDEFKRQTLGSKYPGYLYSDFPTSLSSVPYFFPFAESQSESAETGPHLVVCVHGLDGEKKSGAALVVCGEKE